MKKRWLACTMGILLSLSLVMTSLADVQAEEIGTDVQSEEVQSEEVQSEDEEVLASTEENTEKDEEQASAEGEIEEESEDVILEEETAIDSVDEQTEVATNDLVQTSGGTNDLVQIYTPTVNCPVSKVEFKPQSDGQLDLRVTVNLDVLKNAGYTNGDYYYSMEAINLTTNSYWGAEEGNLIVSGEREYRFFTDKNSNYSLTWNQEFTFKYSLFDQNPQLDPDPINNPTEFKCTAPSPFTGFSAKYVAGASGDRVDVKYEGYRGRFDDSMNNLFLRENLSNGTIRMIGDIDSSHYRGDSQFTPATTYTYYVVKNRVLFDLLPGLWQKVDSTERSFTAEEKAKLRTISTFAEVKIPGPRIVNVSNLKATPGVRSASLTWKYDYETIEPNVSGFYVKIYASNGKLYKTYNNTSQRSSYCSATYAIPYKGTYYFTVTPYYIYEGETYEGTATGKVACTSKGISAATGSVIKINDKKASINIRKAAGSTGTIVYQYTGGKWVKLGSTTGTSYTTTKNTAGKKKYRFLSYIVENGVTYNGVYSGTYSPKANVKYMSHASYDPNYYTYATSRFLATKLYYSKNKLKISGYLLNSRIFTLKKAKITVYVYAQGKLIGKQTFTNKKKVGNMKKRNLTFTFKKGKKDYDLTKATISVKVTPTWF